MYTGTSVACPNGGTPPIEYPVAVRAVSASAFSTGSPATAASSFSSSRFAPLTSATTGLPPATNTNDLTICPTSQPTARAASTAVLVPAGNSFTAMPVSVPASHASNRLIGSQDREPHPWSGCNRPARNRTLVTNDLTVATSRGHGRRRIHRLAPVRPAPRAPAQGSRGGQLYGPLPARAQRKEPQRLEGASGLRFRGARPRRRGPSAHPSRGKRDLPPCRPAGRASQLGGAVRQLPPRQRPSHSAPARVIERDTRRPVGIRGKLVGLRRCGDVPDQGDRPSPPRFALRRDQAGGRAPHPPLHQELRPSCGVRSVLHGVRPAPAARHGLLAVHAGTR